MRFLWRRILRRFTLIGRVLDGFLLAGIALRFAHRKGWVTDDLMRSVGLDSAIAPGGGAVGGEAAFGLSALWRIWRRRRLRR